MAISANGMIAKANDNTAWISETEWNSYASIVKQSGCLIVGRRTYHILTKQPEFADLKDVKLVVVSKSEFTTIAPNHFVVSSLKEALEKVKEFASVIVAGGSILNSSFIKEDLVDEIYLDIEPIVLGKGIKLFDDGDFEKELELLETKQLSKDEIQLHYKIIR